MILPQQPGLLRRLAYGEIIRHKHRNRWSPRYTIDVNNTMNNTMNNTINNTSVYGFSISPIHYDIYEDDPIIETVGTGLSLNDLIVNSTIEFCDPEFFCSICHDDTSSNTCNIRRILTCDHSFHIYCIDIWFTTSTTCPVCRLDLSS